MYHWKKRKTTLPTREEFARQLRKAHEDAEDRDVGIFSCWLAVADAALSALKGPRTGEELYSALSAACEATGALLRAPVWSNADPQWQAAYNHVAATFAAPPIPEGWPEGFTLAAVEVTPIGDPSREWLARIKYQRKVFCSIYGATREEAEHLARLTAWTIANRRPMARAAEIPPMSAAERTSGGISRQVYDDLKRDHAALLAAVDGPGGYREQISSLTARSESTIVARLNLTSHLTPTVLRALRPGLLSLLAESGEVSPEQVDEALDDPAQMAALILRVRAVSPL